MGAEMRTRRRIHRPRLRSEYDEYEPNPKSRADDESLIVPAIPARTELTFMGMREMPTFKDASA
jgi:hypothetical protein